MICLFIFASNFYIKLIILIILQRINVMLTRAKSLLIIIGNEQTLQTNEIWKEVITHCRENRSVIYGDEPFQKDQNLK